MFKQFRHVHESVRIAKTLQFSWQAKKTFGTQTAEDLRISKILYVYQKQGAS